jgi:tRNA modification GTPase
VQVARVQHHLTQALAIVEVGLDYPDEGLPASHMHWALIEIEEAISLTRHLVAVGEANAPWLGRVEVVITGPPNVGKSTLLNRLAREDRAIVDAEPGTTRDLVRAQCLWDGLAVEVVDTAGLRDPTSRVEAEGIRRTQAAAARAGIVLVVLDGSTPWQAEDTEAWRAGGGRGIVVVNKADLPCRKKVPEEVASSGPVVWISATNGTGVEEMIAIARRMVRPQVEAEGVVLTRERHRRCLAEVAVKAADAGVTLRTGGPPECAAMTLREALTTAGEIVGVDVGEEVLEAIFSEFCVGK